MVDKIITKDKRYNYSISKVTEKENKKKNKIRFRIHAFV